MLSSILSKIGFVSLMSLVSFSASAELVMDSRSKPPPPPVYVFETIAPSPVVALSGTTPTQVKRVYKNFKNAPVYKVLRSVIPRDYKALNNNAGIDVDLKITLNSGGRPWNEVLADVLYAADCRADLNWDKKQLIINPKKK